MSWPFAPWLVVGVLAAQDFSLLEPGLYGVRTWTATNGKTVEAAFQKFEGRSAVLKGEEGKVLRVPVTSFGATDQAWLKQVVSAQKEVPKFSHTEAGRAAAAFRHLQTLGDIGRIELHRGMVAWFEEEFVPLIESPPTVDKKTAPREACVAFFALQKEALAHNQKVDKAGLVRARQYYNDLDRAATELIGEMVDLGDVEASLARLEVFRTRAQEHSTSAYLAVRVRFEAIEQRLTELRDNPRPLATGRIASREPSFPPDAFRWRYQKQEAHKAAQRARKHGMTDGERENAELLNHYRWLLGLALLDLDPELVVAARSHSDEMRRLDYFSHISPTPGRKTFMDRATRAGYGAATGENIVWGRRSGTDAFWAWFDSPGHHHNMLGDHRDLGVGRSETHWTQVFGRGE